MSQTPSSFSQACPLPIQQYPQVLLAHGGGGTLMQQLIQQMFTAAFGDQVSRHDAATLPQPSGAIAFTTDSYVIHPLFFPGGNIGSLAIYGTTNDLAMAGAIPQYVSVGFILEEGLAMETLWRVVQSMAQAAKEVGVTIVTGDTKVVDRGQGDGIFINTAAIGAINHSFSIQPQSIAEGDRILVSGDLGRHGIAIMAQREGLAFETTITSDCGALGPAVQSLLEAGIEVHCLRDLTRGGLSSAVNEIAIAGGHRLHLEETTIPVATDVQGACEILGFDPLYVANEGRFVAFVPPHQEREAVAILRRFHPQATAIGEVREKSPSPWGLVTLNSAIGAERVLDMLSGEQLPRIC